MSSEKSGASVSGEQVISTACASHCGGSCILKVHVKDGVITRIETDDGEDPQFRACLKGRAYRQRVYAPDRILYPLKRVGERGEGKFVRISWDEAIDAVASNYTRIRDTYGPASVMLFVVAGELGNLHTHHLMIKVLSQAGGYTRTWAMASFQGGVYAQMATYGTSHTANTRDDLLNSKLIIMWGWNPASAVTGVNSTWYLTQAKEKGTRIVAIDPRCTDSAAILAHEWIPIRPGTDGAMLVAMAYVIIKEKLEDRKFLEQYTVGFEKFKDYVMGTEDGIPKTPAWAEHITGVPATTIAQLAREYAATKPAALIAGIAPGRVAFGEQYHRIAITLAAMTGNVGVHGGDAAGRAWESLEGYPYKVHWGGAWDNPVDNQAPKAAKGTPPWYKVSRVHFCDVADFILNGKAGGYQADCKMVVIANGAYVGTVPNVNKIVKALKSKHVEMIAVQEQFMNPTVKFADIVLPTNTFMERNDLVSGVGTPVYLYAHKVLDPLGESKSQYEIACLLAKKLGVKGFEATEEQRIKEMIAGSEIPDYDEFKKKGVFHIRLPEPHVALKEYVDDPEAHPLRTPSKKIEIASSLWADLNNPELPAVPKYIPSWEGRDDPLAAKYPLQLITSHFRRRSNNQYDSIPWLRETEPQAISINSVDAKARGIADGDMVHVFNDRGRMKILAKVTERIMPGVVDVPQGAWYEPDANGVDQGGCANMLCSDRYSYGGAFMYNATLVQVEKA